MKPRITYWYGEDLENLENYLLQALRSHSPFDPMVFHQMEWE